MPLLKTVRLTPHFTHCSSDAGDRLQRCNGSVAETVHAALAGRGIAAPVRVQSSADLAGDEADSADFDLPVD